MFRCRKRSANDLDVAGGAKKPRMSKAPMYRQRRRVFSRDDPLDDSEKPWSALGAWFMGPKAENGDVFRDLIMQAIDSQIHFRHSYFPCDPVYVTDEIREAGSYKSAMVKLRKEMETLQNELRNSVPFFSSRYKGHVLWETAMPANLGYISAFLFNQNNCVGECSTVTTKFELEVGTDLCGMLGYDKQQSMGHLVAGGTIANIEAIWAARNVKFFPLALQEAILKEERLVAAKDYKVFFPQRGENMELLKASQWELFNLDTDTILAMPAEVEEITGLNHTELMEVLFDYLYESIGAQEFGRRHMLTKSPCVVVPSTGHVSFMKTLTILGLGKASLVTVAVDEDARLDSKELNRVLREKLRDKIPVISVVAVMGTTEESAVDPLTEVLELRQNFRLKGLNFSIHADGAWGGYFTSMLGDQPKDYPMRPPEESGFVPELWLSSYVHKQLSAINQCDTITIDPHKSGFCPYPAGALCYRDRRMNGFLKITNKVVYYHGDKTLGDVGLEGSKPGAAAAGVMLANRVIGLHKNGYGRILAECMFTAKIMYCLWITLARENDKFVIRTTKRLPAGKEEEHINFIRHRIIGKSNEELAQDEEAMQYLKEIGPDTMVPCFSINLKGNKDVNLCNALNMALFQAHCHTSSEQTAHRIPLIVTASSLVPHKHSSALKNFKKRLGLNCKNQTPVKYIVTTCMDPWATSVEFMGNMAAIMRNSILCAIGTVTDPDEFHDFISTGKVSEQNEVIVYYVGNFNVTGKQYDTLAKLQFINTTDAEKYIATQAKLLESSNKPIVFRSKAKKLHDVFFGESKYGDASETFDCFVGLPTDCSEPFMTADMKVVDVPRYEHFDDDEYPAASSYFMYGNKKTAFLFHIPSEKPDFLQIVKLDGIPVGVGSHDGEDILLKYGVEVELMSIPGAPFMEAGNVVDPLKNKEYNITFVGIDGEEVYSKVKLGKKIWFDGQVINS